MVEHPGAEVIRRRYSFSKPASSTGVLALCDGRRIASPGLECLREVSRASLRRVGIVVLPELHSACSVATASLVRNNRVVTTKLAYGQGLIRAPLEGAHIIASSFYRGGEVIAPNLTSEQRVRYYKAENEAVDLINADFYKYAHHVAAHAKGALKPNELLKAFVRYKHVDVYDQTLFGRTYDWMKARGLSDGKSEHASLVLS